MMAPRFSVSPRPVACGLALLIGLAHGTIASAQGFTPDPYRPYNSVYDPYVYPIYPRADGYFPNQNRLLERTGPAQANQFQQFLDSGGLGTEPSPLGSRGSAGAGVPYFHAYRRDNPNNRPNNSEADRLFRERQEERDTRFFEARKKYQEAVNERDPKKRSRLIREYAAAKRLAEQEFNKPSEPSAPGQRPATDSGEPANPPAPRRPQDAGPRPSTSPAAPAPLRETVLPGRVRSRLSPSPARPGRVGPSPTVRSPSQILRESEALDLADPSLSPPPGPRLQPSPAPR